MGMSKKRSLATKTYVKKCMRNALATKEITVTGVIGNSGVPTTSGRVDPIGTFNIIEGNSDDDREGNWITRDSVVFRFICQKPAADVSGALFRVVIFHDSQTNGATPAITDVLATGTGGVACGFNGDNVVGWGGKRFKIIKDYMFNINSQASGATGESLLASRSWTYRMKGGGTVHFDSSAGTISTSCPERSSSPP